MVQRVQSLRSSVKNTRPAQGTREPGELYVSFPDLQLGVIDTAKAAKDLIAVRYFSNATDYAIGDFVINGGTGYRAKVAITAGAFNAANWDTIATTANAEPPIAAGTVSQYWRGDKSWQTLDKTAVGLGNVDNTSDVNKPISSATQTALNLKAPIASPALTGTPTAPTPTPGLVNTQIATTAFVSAAINADVPTWGEISGIPATFPPTLPIPSTGVTGLDTKQASQDAAIAAIVSFPEAPQDGLTYGRKNAQWATMVGGAVISDTPPPGPLTPGQLWWESDTGNTYLWFDDGDTQQWVQQNIQPAPPVGGVPVGTIRQTVLNTPGAGNYVKPVGLKYLEVTLIGGGGGGAGVLSTAVGQSTAGAGGGGGGTCIKLYAAADLAASTPYVIGAGGLFPGGVGAAGEASTFAGLTAGAGAGTGALLAAGATVSATAGGAGGAAVGGDLNISGSPGGNGIRCVHGVPNFAYPGVGGTTFIAPARFAASGIVGASSAAVVGIWPGGGASGAAVGQSQASLVGAAGAAGGLILKEYF